MIILDEKSVYAVLEYHSGKKCENTERLHGVYTTREIADKVADKIRSKTSSGYVCVLKQRIRGPLGKLSFRRIKHGKN